MGENLLESYNPLYDVHLRQYFALPHMQKHLRNLGLLDGSPVQQSNELQAGHLAMMDLMLRNRERVLQQLMDLQRKLDAAEKVELYRRIRSGITNADEANRHHQQQQHMSRSLSRPARSAIARLGERRGRRQSLSPEASELIKRVESDYRSDSAPFKNPKSIYNRLAASVYKYQYLHKLDDRTLRKYMLSLRKQLAKLERFREVSFGPHTMAKHPPQQLQQSWFFRRRSLKSGLSHKTRGGKSQSPLKFANAIDEPPLKVQRRTSNSRTRQRLPPLPKKRSFAASRTNTLPTSKTTERLPQTTVTKPIRKTPPDPRRVPPSSTAQKKTPTDSRPGSKGSTTPVPVPKRPSASSGGILPAIEAAAVAAGAVHLVLDGKGKKTEEEEGEARESAAPSPSISLAASQTTTTDGQPGGDSEWEEQRKSSAKTEEAPEGINGGTETRPTPELFLEQEIGKEGEKDNGTSEEKGMERTEEQQTKTPTEEEKRGEEDKTEGQRMADFQRENAPSPEERDEAKQSPMEEKAFVGQTMQTHPAEERTEDTYAESVDHPATFEEITAKTDEREGEDSARSVDHHFDEVNAESDEHGEDSARSVDHHFEEVNARSDHVGEEGSPGSVDHHFEEVNARSDHVGEEGSPGSVDHHFDEVNAGSDACEEEASPGSVDHHFEEVNARSGASPGSVDHHFEEVNAGSDAREEEASPGSVDHHFEEVKSGSDHVGEEASPRSVDHHFEGVNAGSDERGEEIGAGSVDHLFGTALSVDHQHFEDPASGSQKFDQSWEHKSFEEDNDEQPKKLTIPDEYDQSDFLIENESVGEQEKEIIREEIGFNSQAENGEKPSFEEEKCPPEGCQLYRDDLVESEEVLRNEHDLGRKLSKTEDLSKKMEVSGIEITKEDEHSAETHIVKEDQNWMEHEEEKKREEKEGKREEEEKREEKREEEEEGTIHHYGEPRGNPQEEEEEATNEVSERELDQNANEAAKMGHEVVAGMEDLERRPSHHSSAENGISPRQSDDGTRPATAEEIRQSFGETIGANQLISQPHIQITSASEHGGSVEANLDSPKMQKGRGEIGEGERSNEAQLEGRQQTEAQTETNNAEGHQQKQSNGTGKEADRGETRNGHSEAREGAFLGESEGSDEDDGSVIIRNQKPKSDEWTELEANSDGK